MEKTGDDQFVVTKEEGKLVMRLPGGSRIPYDNRFPDLPNLNEGENYIIPNTEKK